MYFSPIIFSTIALKMYSYKKKLIIKSNFFILFIILIFPIYKFTEYNYGIGKYDSFPSIQKLEMKKEIEWKFDKKEYLNCKQIVLNFKKWNYYNPETISERFKSIYITVHLLNNNFKFIKYNTLINLNNKMANSNCEILNL